MCLITILSLLAAGCGSSGSDPSQAEPPVSGLSSNTVEIWLQDKDGQPIKIKEAMGSTGQEVPLPFPQGWEECCFPPVHLIQNSSVPTVKLVTENGVSYLIFDLKAKRDLSTDAGDWFLEKARGNDLQYKSHALGLSLGDDFKQTKNTFFPEKLHFAFGVDLRLIMQNGDELFCPSIILGQGQKTDTKRFGISSKDIEKSGINVADGNWIGAIFDFTAEIFDILPFKFDENNWWAAQRGEGKEIYKTTVNVAQISPTPDYTAPAILIECSDSDMQVVYGKLFPAGSDDTYYDNMFSLNLNWPKEPPGPVSSWPAGSWICSCDPYEGLTWDGEELCALCTGKIGLSVPSCASGCQSFMNSDGELKCEENDLPPGRWQCSCDTKFATWDGDELCASCNHDHPSDPTYSCKSGCDGFDSKGDLLVCDDLFNETIQRGE